VPVLRFRFAPSR